MTTEVLLLSLVVLFALNAPIAIAIGGASIVAILVQGDFPLMMVVQRMFGGTNSFHLMAVPLFMFTGVIMTWNGAIDMGHIIPPSSLFCSMHAASVLAMPIP